jgi:hypothetical protein
MADAVALLEPDAVFHSPIVHHPYIGRDAVAPVLMAVATVFEDFRYTASYSSADGGHVLVFAAHVGDRELEGVDILVPSAAGGIAELTVMVRPYSAATELRSRMAAMLAGA